MLSYYLCRKNDHGIYHLPLVKVQVTKVLFKPCRVWILTEEDTKLTIPSILLLRVHQLVVKVEPAMLKAPLLFSKLNSWKAVRSRGEKSLCQNMVLFMPG